METLTYRGYTIEYRSKPVPSRCMDWEWTCDGWDIDMPHDLGVGFASSKQAAMAAVDFDIEEQKL